MRTLQVLTVTLEAAPDVLLGLIQAGLGFEAIQNGDEVVITFTGAY